MKYIENGDIFYFINSNIPIVVKMRSILSYKGNHGIFTSWKLLWKIDPKNSVTIENSNMITGAILPGVKEKNEIFSFITKDYREAIEKLLQ